MEVNLKNLGAKAQTPLIRFVVDLLWICCGFVVDWVYYFVQNDERR